MGTYFELNTGAKIPSIGLGTWKASPGDVGRAVIHAVKVCFIVFFILLFSFPYSDNCLNHSLVLKLNLIIRQQSIFNGNFFFSPYCFAYSPYLHKSFHVQAGYRHIDCASVYGNEREVSNISFG